MWLSFSLLMDTGTRLRLLNKDLNKDFLALYLKVP